MVQQASNSVMQAIGLVSCQVQAVNELERRNLCGSQDSKGRPSLANNNACYVLSLALGLGRVHVAKQIESPKADHGKVG